MNDTRRETLDYILNNNLGVNKIEVIIDEITYRNELEAMFKGFISPVYLQKIDKSIQEYIFNKYEVKK